LTSPYVPPDTQAFGELERLLRHVTEELSSWRRRCLAAESELQGLKGQEGMVPGQEMLGFRARVLDLERENVELHSRVERARELVTHLQDRLVFLEEDVEGAARR
jgi:predicted  nucleic acid-binding Zn-ribbon protein